MGDLLGLLLAVLVLTVVTAVALVSGRGRMRTPPAARPGASSTVGAPRPGVDYRPGTGDDADAPRTAQVEEVTDDETTTVVRSGGYVVSLARVVGTPLGEGDRLVATLGEDPTQHVLATVRRG